MPLEYSYKNAPTLLAFARDNTLNRAIVGPFGCLSGDTEYLTPTGWNKISNYTGGFIAEYDTTDKGIIFREPKQYISLPCDSFLAIKNLYGIDQLLSDEHTVVFTTRFQPDTWRTVTAYELSVRHNALGDGWSGLIHTTFGAPYTIGVDLSDDELRLMVAISADGHFAENSSTNWCIVTLRKDRKKDRLRGLLSRLNIGWSERNYPNRPTETIFGFYAPEKNKKLYNYYNANARQLYTIADEVVHWDGCTDKYGGIIFSSNDKGNADFVQYCFATIGKRATVTSVEYTNPNWNTNYRVYVGTGATELSMRQAPPITRVPSTDGKKYCFTTESGYFVARRNGRIFITGNSGKSSACAIEVARRAMSQEPGVDGVSRTRFAVVRNTYGQLRDTTIPTFMRWLGTLGNYKSSEYDFYITDLVGPKGNPCECIVHFRALDRPGDIRNLLSLEVTGAWFNEAKEIEESIVKGMRGRIGRYPPVNPDGSGGCTWHGIWFDTNPPDVDHWFYKYFEKVKPLRCPTCKGPHGEFVLLQNGLCMECKGTEGIPLSAIFHQPSGFSKEAENLPFLPRDYYANIAAGMDQDFINVFVHGQYGYVRDGKPVYANYNPSWHLSKEEIKATPGIPLILGFDNTGLNQACVACQYMPNGQFRILHEWLVEDMGTRRLCNDIIAPFIFAKYPGVKLLITGDPAGVRRSDTDERTTFEEIYEAFRKSVDPIPARSNAWQARFNAVDSLLTKRIGKHNDPGLLVSSECNMVHSGFMGQYRFRRLQMVGRERYVDKPEKNLIANVHDALQYAAMYIEEMWKAERSEDEQLIISPSRASWNGWT